MIKKPGGTKRSSWLTFRRRLLLVRLLLRAPTGGAELIAAVEAEMGDAGYPAAAASALKHDFDALKDEFGCVIRFQRRSGLYVLEDLGELALLDLPDSCMEALTLLESSFPGDVDLPTHAHIRNLLERVVLLLPERRRAQYRQARATMRLHFAGTSERRINETVLSTVQRAIKQRRELVFSYQGSDADGLPRRHRVAPYGISFRPEGHGYLDATALEVSPPGNAPLLAAIDYRLDRIVPGSLEVLSQVLPPARIAPPTYALRYTLVAAVASRRDVAAYFPNTQIIYHVDGSANVTATITNLWQARQILLRYGTGCIVEEPAELVALFRATARGLADLYGV